MSHNLWYNYRGRSGPSCYNRLAVLGGQPPEPEQHSQVRTRHGTRALTLRVAPDSNARTGEHALGTSVPAGEIALEETREVQGVS